MDFTKLLASGALLRDDPENPREEPSRVLLLWGPFKAEAADKKQEISVSCPDYFDGGRARFLIPEKSLWIKSSELRRICLRALEEFSKPETPLVWKEPSREDFESAFARTQNLIQQGQIDKAVPVVFARAEGEVTPEMKTRWLLEILGAPSSLHVHAFWDGDEGLIGATPEILFDLKGRELQTMALAGTLAKEEGSGADLFRSSKDQQEHRYVVEDIRHELSRLGHVRIGETKIKELPALWHLQTEIRASLNEEPDAADLMHRLHPTAALGVFPRSFGWRWMMELPGQTGRRRFGAPFTVRLSEDRVRSLVSIRNLQWQGREVLLGSGCGVVASSHVDAEWNELSRKRQSVLRLFGMVK